MQTLNANISLVNSESVSIRCKKKWKDFVMYEPEGGGLNSVGSSPELFDQHCKRLGIFGWEQLNMSRSQHGSMVRVSAININRKLLIAE